MLADNERLCVLSRGQWSCVLTFRILRAVFREIRAVAGPHHVAGPV